MFRLSVAGGDAVATHTVAATASTAAIHGERPDGLPTAAPPMDFAADSYFFLACTVTAVATFELPSVR